MKEIVLRIIATVTGLAMVGFSLWFFATNKSWDLGGSQVTTCAWTAAVGAVLAWASVLPSRKEGNGSA